MTHQLYEDLEVDGDQFRSGDEIIHCGTVPVVLGKVSRTHRNYVFRNAHCPGCNEGLEVVFGHCPE